MLSLESRGGGGARVRGCRQPAVAAVAEAIAARITHSTAVQLFCFGTTYSPAWGAGDPAA